MVFVVQYGYASEHVLDHSLLLAHTSSYTSSITLVPWTPFCPGDPGVSDFGCSEVPAERSFLATPLDLVSYPISSDSSWGPKLQRDPGKHMLGRYTYRPVSPLFFLFVNLLAST